MLSTRTRLFLGPVSKLDSDVLVIDFRTPTNIEVHQLDAATHLVSRVRVGFYDIKTRTRSMSSCLFFVIGLQTLVPSLFAVVQLEHTYTF